LTRDHSVVEDLIDAGQLREEDAERHPAAHVVTRAVGTEADLEVDRMLRAELLAARPGYGWLSEESEDGPERLDAERVFIVDPIDGTRAFIDGQAGFAHAIAVVERGQVTAAVVHLPARKEVYAAALGQGATLNGAPIRARDPAEMADAEVLTTRPMLDPKHWPGGVPAFRRAYRTAIAWRISLVGSGQFDATLTFRPTWEWDVAAASLIATEAGAVVTDETGAALTFNRPNPRVRGIVAAGPGLHAGFMARRLEPGT
ncbi:MAG: inositol monophosphatase family protein, partial [Pseudomonadota bacterium]